MVSIACGAFGSLRGGATQKQKLGKMPDGPKYDPRVKEENERLKVEIKNLRDKFVKLQGRSIDTVKEQKTFR